MKPMKRKKITKAKWEENVRKARAYTKDYSKARWVIAELALEVCDYSYGGDKSSSYSLKKFAQEIELETKTLYNWVRIKRMVYDKLPKTVQTKAHEHNFSDFISVSGRIDHDSTPLQVRKQWAEQMKLSPDSNKFEKYLSHINAILFNAARPIRMKDIKAEILIAMIEKMTLCVSLLQKELEFREKYPSRVLENAARVGIKDELAKRLNIGEDV